MTLHLGWGWGWGWNALLDVGLAAINVPGALDGRPLSAGVLGWCLGLGFMSFGLWLSRRLIR